MNKHTGQKFDEFLLEERIKELESELRHEKRDRKALAHQLSQQRFNNKNNLSIDQNISDRIKKLEEEKKTHETTIIELIKQCKEYQDKNKKLKEENKDLKNTMTNIEYDLAIRIKMLKEENKKLKKFLNLYWDIQVKSGSKQGFMYKNVAKLLGKELKNE